MLVKHGQWAYSKDVGDFQQDGDIHGPLSAWLCIGCCRHGPEWGTVSFYILKDTSSFKLLTIFPSVKYPLAIVERLLNALGGGIGGGYDIRCKFATTLKSSPLGHHATDLSYTLLIGSFHGHAHNRICQLSNLAHYIKSMGLKDLEGC